MSDFVKYPKVNGLYQHYKGGVYRVITMAIHTETKENLVICKSELFGTIYARPISSFFETITNSSGQREPRFTSL